MEATVYSQNEGGIVDDIDLNYDGQALGWVINQQKDFRVVT